MNRDDFNEGGIGSYIKADRLEHINNKITDLQIILNDVRLENGDPYLMRFIRLLEQMKVVLRNVYKRR